MKTIGQLKFLLHSIHSYSRFLAKSTNQHGVHSPFVFQLVTKCLYEKQTKPAYQLWKKYQQDLFQNHQVISVTDFSTGSKVFASNQRKVSSIAKHAGMNFTKAKLLIKLVQYFQPKKVLELRTSLGLGTFALHLGNPIASITTIEGCEQTLFIAKRNWLKFTSNDIYFILDNFQQLPPKLNQVKWDFIFFDGNHSKKATLSYLEELLPSITNESVWVFDDIHWSKDMEAAWDAIKNHPKVTVTIDLYHVGLVFFRTEQAKEHFIIRT